MLSINRVCLGCGVAVTASRAFLQKQHEDFKLFWSTEACGTFIGMFRLLAFGMRNLISGSDV